MLPDRESNPGPLTYESGVLLIALRGPALRMSNELDAHAQDKASLIMLFGYTDRSFD